MRAGGLACAFIFFCATGISNYLLFATPNLPKVSAKGTSPQQFEWLIR